MIILTKEALIYGLILNQRFELLGRASDDEGREGTFKMKLMEEGAPITFEGEGMDAESIKRRLEIITCPCFSNRQGSLAELLFNAELGYRNASSDEEATEVLKRTNRLMFEKLD